MSKNNKEKRQERRNLLHEIMNRLILLLEFNDTDLEHINIQWFKNLNQDLENILRQASYGERYIHEPYISTNDHDGTPKTAI